MGYERRVFTHTFVKQQLQTTGLVSESDSDEAHLEALVVHVSAMTKRVLARSWNGFVGIFGGGSSHYEGEPAARHEARTAGPTNTPLAWPALPHGLCAG